MTVKPMTPRQRLLAAMRCEQPDRVPIQVRGVYPTHPDWMKDHHESYRVLHDLVRDRCDPVHPFAMGSGWFGIDRDSVNRRVDEVPVDADWVEDVVTIETARGPLTRSFRRSLRGEPGFQMKHAVSSEEEAERFLSIPVAPPRPNVDGFFETVERVGERALVIAEIGSDPIGLVQNLIGSETLAIWSLTARGMIERLLAALVSRWTSFVERVLDAGVGPVLATLGHELALPPLLAPNDFRDFVVDVEKPVMDMIHHHDCLVHVHCHYNLSKVLDGFVTMGVNCLHPVEAPPMGDIELAEAKRRLAGKVCIEGNLQIGELQEGTPAEIRETTRRIIEDASEGGGLILCPTASPFWPTLSDRTRDNYRAFVEAAREFGVYGPTA